jgi:hypothetical protein
MNSGYGEVNGVGTSDIYDPDKVVISRDPGYYLPQMVEEAEFWRIEWQEEVSASIGAAATEIPSWEC